MNMGLVWVLALGLVIATVAGAGIDPLPPRTVLEQFTCGQLAALDETARERALIYLAGVVDGRRGTRTFDAEVVGTAVDRAVTACAETPAQSVLETLTRVWR